MTDQLQPTREQWAPPAGTPENTDQDQAGALSTQDSTASGSTDGDRPADDGTVYRSAGHDTTADQLEASESVADGTANHTGESVEPVDGSVRAGHADPDHAIGVASVPDTAPDADAVDRGTLDDAAVREVEATGEQNGVPAMTDTGPSSDVDGGAEVAGGDTPLVPAPIGHTESPDVTHASETLPGDLPDEPGLALFDSETTQRFRDRWHELQLRFVDDPHFAEGQAVALVDEVVTALRDAVDRQREALHDWQAGQGADPHTGDTERMRVAVRRYRDFLDHLLGV
jgi:hypothetical protein